MQKKQATWELINKSLHLQIPVMLLYVLESNGSSPGRQGFFMAVNLTGEMQGSIGGGIMEHKFVEMAKEQLRHTEQLLSVRKQVHDKSSKHQSGMICSGDQTMLIYRLQPGDMTTVNNILVNLQTSGDGILQLSPGGIGFENSTGNNFYFRMHSEADWLYRERLGYKNKIFIIGGGHCSLALSKIMRMMDFYVHVFDHRTDLHTLLQNEAAHEKTIIPDYSQLCIPEGLHHYVVLMTLGYRTDDAALRTLLHRHYRYVGVLGSQTKINQLFSDYLAAGIEETVLSRLHAPVGMPIKSQTPEEIAISIAAEIIQVKSIPL